MDNDRFQELVLQQLSVLTEGQKELTTRFDKLGNKIDKLELRIENEVIDKIRGLYDAREIQNDVNERIIYSLNRIEAKLDVLQMETASVRRVK